MPTRNSVLLWMAALSATLALLLLLVACGSNPEPTSPPVPASAPTATTAPATMTDPTATPVPPPPTATPVPPPPTNTPVPPPTEVPDPTATPAPPPTQAPDPTDEPAPPQAMMSLEDFVITGATTGGDLMSLLSEQETSCVKTVLGESVYQLILATPITLMAGGDISQTAPLFNCLEEENVVYLAIAFLDLQAGGWDGESRSCITEIALLHPDAVYIRLGLDLGEGPIDPQETLDHNIAIYDCLPNEDKKEFTLGMWMALDIFSQATGADIFALLTEEEAVCVRNALPSGQLAAIVNASPLQAITIGSPASDCISHDTNVDIFVHGIQWSLGGTTDKTRACLQGFAEANPEYVQLFTSGLEGIFAMPADEFVKLTEAGNDQYACMTEEEVLRVQQSVTAALANP